MSTFNPYQQWLGIDGAVSQPDHYQLLGLSPGQSDPAIIAQAADRAILRVRGVHPGENAAVWARLLDELKQAKQCLLDPAQRAQYNQQLSSTQGAVGPPAASPPQVPLRQDAGVAWNGANGRGANPMAAFAPAMPGAPATPAARAMPPAAAARPASVVPAVPPSAAAPSPSGQSGAGNAYAGQSSPYPGHSSQTPADPMAPVGYAPPTVPSNPSGGGVSPTAGTVTPTVGPTPDPMAPLHPGPGAPSAFPPPSAAPPGYGVSPSLPSAVPATPWAPYVPPGQGNSYSPATPLGPAAAHDPMAPVTMPGAIGGHTAYPSHGGYSQYNAQAGQQTGQAAHWHAQGAPAGYASPQVSAPGAYGAPNPMAPVAHTPRAVPSSPGTPAGGYGAAYGPGAGSAYQGAPAGQPNYVSGAAPAAQAWSAPSEPQPQVRSSKTSTARAAAERARRARQTYAFIALGAACVLAMGGVVIVAMGGLGGSGGGNGGAVARNDGGRRPLVAAPRRPSTSSTGRTVDPRQSPSANTGYAPRDRGTWPPTQSPASPRPSEPAMPRPGDLRTDPSFLPDADPNPAQPPLTPDPSQQPVNPVPGTAAPTVPVPKTPDTPEPEPAPSTPPPPPMPTAEELAELSRDLKAARAALAELNVDAADAVLAKAEPLARLPEHKQKYDRLHRLAGYVRRFREAMVQAFNKLHGGDSITVGTSTQVGIVETTSDKIIVRVAGMNKTYAMHELPVGLASAIVDLALPQSADALIIKGAYVAVSSNSSELHRETARDWWQEAKQMGGDVGDLPEFFNDSYDFAPAAAK